MARFHPGALLALVVAVQLSACAQGPKAPISAEEVGEIEPGRGYLRGYLSYGEMPDSLALLPPPPVEGSAAHAEDLAAFKALTAFAAGPRGEQARRDAELRFPAGASHFSCALGVDISEARTPHLYMLLRRTLVDAGSATYKAKDHYRRTRPFAALNTTSCTPEEEAYLSKDGSYPSGHSALGWAWALILTQVAPERADTLLQRGRSYSQSRGVCGVHWKSDIDAGRLVGAAAVARLQDNATFQAQAVAARKEVRQAWATGQTPPAAQCEAEARALSLSTHLAP